VSPSLTAKKVVIGSTIEALSKADANKAIIILNGYCPPHEIEENKAWKEWHHMVYKLGLKGLVFAPLAIEKIRVSDHLIKIITENSRTIEVKFGELYIFDLALVEGVAVEENVNKYIVYDWFDIRRGAKQIVDHIRGEGEFVSSVSFYPSKRRDGNDGSIKDCYTKSCIEADDLDKFEFSETSARFAAMKLIQREGLKGPTRTFGEKSHHLNLVLEHNHRSIYKLEKKYIVSEDLLPNDIFLV
tara:strand:+ start:447 stop:1175 length:729 start_codon:yes stop_codon:yes gene_type:complete